MNPTEYLRNSKWLRDQYESQQKSIDDIAAKIDCDRTYVWRWLKKHNIPRRMSGKGGRTGQRGHPTPETRAKMSLAQKARHERRRVAGDKYFLSDETRKKMSIAQKAYLADHPEALAKLREYGLKGTKIAVNVRRHFMIGPASFLWKGGHNTTWGTRVKQALIEESPICCLCGYKRALIAHHIDKIRSNNLHTNVLILCPNCHYLLHRNLLTPEEGFQLDQCIEQAQKRPLPKALDPTIPLHDP